MGYRHSFAGKKVLITGGGQGIGRHLVQRFHDGGAKVYTLDKNADAIAKLREELPTVTAEVVDITDWKATRDIIESFGPIDHLVNNAGIFIPQKFMDITEDAAALHYSVNVGAVINVTQAVAKGMIASGSGGTVVNISSVGARNHIPPMTCYNASKAALEMLTKSMAIELGPDNIRVNCILPGKVNVPLPESVAVNKELTDFIKGVPEKMIIKRLVEANEIADLVLYLLCPLSQMMFGEAVVIDGGLTLL